MSRRTCEHIQDDGVRCTNPAMYRRRVCYHHWRLLRPSAPVCDPAFVPPTFDSEASVSLMTAHILRCLLAGKIDRRMAQVAMTCVRETAKSLRLQGKAGDNIETSFTHFMADYYSALDEIQQKSAAAYPDPQPLIYPAHFADLPEDDEEEGSSLPAPLQALSSRAPLSGEKSASCPQPHNRAANRGRASAPPEAECSDHHNSTDNRGRAGLQPRVAGSENVGALAPVESAPAAATDNKLSATQTKLLKKILRRGPSHPQFHRAVRLLDHHLSPTTASG